MEEIGRPGREEDIMMIMIIMMMTQVSEIDLNKSMMDRLSRERDYA